MEVDSCASSILVISFSRRFSQHWLQHGKGIGGNSTHSVTHSFMVLMECRQCGFDGLNARFLGGDDYPSKPFFRALMECRRQFQCFNGDDYPSKPFFRALMECRRQCFNDAWMAMTTPHSMSMMNVTTLPSVFHPWFINLGLRSMHHPRAFHINFLDMFQKPRFGETLWVVLVVCNLLRSLQDILGHRLVLRCFKIVAVHK